MTKGERDPLLWTQDSPTIRAERGAAYLIRTDCTESTADEHDSVPVSATGTA
jgi:hypothetical protein